MNQNDSTQKQQSEEKIQNILQDVQKKLTLKGRKDVFESGRELTKEHLHNPQKPEEFTKKYLIEEIFSVFDVDLRASEVPYQVVGEPGTNHYVDYESRYDDLCIAIQAKPLNQDLFKKGSQGAVNQIISGFKNTGFYKKYRKGGIATDGLRYIIINKNGLVVDDLNIRDDFFKIKKYVTGEGIIPQQKRDEISRKFYREYNELLHGGRKIKASDSFVQSIRYVKRKDDREEIAQLIINRLIFLKFLYERQFIRLQKQDLDFFEYLKSKETESLNGILKDLFFNVMNTPEDERVNVNPMFAPIPYLNGSLFKQAAVEEKHPSYIVDSTIIHKTIEFLDSYNFAEGEMGRKQVQIDPEILGYIFERAMTATDRKGTGAFYTKKSITEFEARKSIENKILEQTNTFLLTRRGYHKEELLKTFDDIYHLRSSSLHEVRDIIEHIKIADNSCGSGAFIIAAAHILFEIIKKVDFILHSDRSEVTVKKKIVQSVYGVDINRRAIEITMLRVWLWVAESFKPGHIDKTGTVKESTIEPLPNLEYHFMSGNTLIGYTSLGSLADKTILLDSETNEKTIQTLLEELVDLKKKYQTTSQLTIREDPTDEEKDPSILKERIEERRTAVNKQMNDVLNREINKKIKRTSRKNLLKRYHPFHWVVECYEVFADDDEHQPGFDIIMGNPPYMQLQNKEKIPAHVQKAYEMQSYETFAKSADIYCLFYERSIKLLREDGLLCYITSNKWMRAKYGKKLRNFLSGYDVRLLLDFGSIRNFENATVDTNIIIIQKRPNTNQAKAVNMRQEFDTAQHMEQYVTHNAVPLQDLSGDIWVIATKEEQAIKQKIEEAGTPLEHWNIQINRGITTGYNNAFIIDKKTKDDLINKEPQTAAHIKPLVRGKNIKRYAIDFKENYLIFIPWHFPLHDDEDISGASAQAERAFYDTYPELYKYMETHKKQLAARNEEETGKRYEWYALQRCAATYYKEFEKEKIIFQEMVKEPQFTYDPTTNYFCNDTGRIITGESLPYLTGLFNSKLFFYAIKMFYGGGKLSGKGVRMKNTFFKNFPAVRRTEKNATLIQDIEATVQKILHKKQTNPYADTTKLEEKIDRIIYNLYGISYNEAQLIDPDLTIPPNKFALLGKKEETKKPAAIQIMKQIQQDEKKNTTLF